MPLDDPEVRKLLDLIRDSFRVRKNLEPIYVDVGNNLDRIGAPQHQVIFGRRGSGKSCLMVHYLGKARKQGVLAIYILADEYKRLTYPDILIRLLLQIVEEIIAEQSLLRRLLCRKIPLRRSAQELRGLLDLASESEVVQTAESREVTQISPELTATGVGKIRASSTTEAAFGRTSRFKERKLELLERHLHDHKKAIVQSLKVLKIHKACVLLDDFYLVPRIWQPDVIDYLHRLLRDTDVYLKVATIRHRTTLLRNQPQTVGVELSQDVEELNLDRTLEDVDSTREYLASMLHQMAIEAKISEVVDTYFNPDALEALTLASGGVPRDFLNIFANAVESAISDRATRWITPRYIWRGAGRLAYQTKLRNLREDSDEDTAGLERTFVDLLKFCLTEKRKTAFLVSQEEAQRFPRGHELIQQLMDMKLIHVIEPDTSAASGRPGRFEAYTLDFSLFMEPRRRNIEHVEFWKRGADRHKVGIREAPAYSLERALEAFEGTQEVSPEEYLEEIQEHEPKRETSEPVQGSLF